MPADSALLSCVPLFEKLDADEKALLAAQLDEETYVNGATIFHKGEPGNSIYIVASGEVEIYVEDTTGGRIVFETAKTGDFFGELSLLDGDPRSASAKAVADVKMLKVDREDLLLLFSRSPHAAIDILGVIGRRLREADKLLGLRPVSSPNQVIEDRLNIFSRLADLTAAFSGTFTFLFLHVIWFAIWIAINVDRVPGVEKFDPYPFGLLTMVVSLEAIFLSCLVLISQNRQGAKDRIRSEVEYEANIRAGLEVTQLHVKIDQLQEQVLGRLASLERRAPPTTSPGTNGAK
jgi:CRP/FNR family cyclic AMP-dependent transcriptional regulator